MAKTLNVALAQINILYEDRAANEKTCRTEVAKAAKKKADIVVFPETTLTASSRVATCGEDILTSPTLTFFKALAKQYRIAILFGMVINGKAKKGYNAAIVIDKSGKILVRYDKMHPFSFSGEQRYIYGGTKLGIFRLASLSCAVIVCYDLRFPGLFAALAKHRPDMVFVIANWPSARANHWQTLLPARALDLQSYIVAVNLVGMSNGKKYGGDSAVYEPRGEKILDLGSKPSLGVCQIKEDLVSEFRRNFSSLSDGRDSLYKKL